MQSKAIILAVAIGLSACQKQTAQGDWIKGTETDQVKLIEKHFRGFDNAMVETDYRYQELYWAGQDENWDYANYQLTKIKLAIENGLQRRPLRAKSAEVFLTDVLPEMQKSVAAKDTAIFNENFKLLTIGCNNCHTLEKLSFFKVKIPTQRQSSISK
jgi:hypothetical protein